MKKYNWFLGIVLLSVVLLVGCSLEKPVSKELKSNEFDGVLSSGDGYNLVYKRVDNYDGAYDMVGVVDDNGRWIHQLSKEHIFINKTDLQSRVNIQNGGGTKMDTRIMGVKSSISYKGEGMFVLSSRDSRNLTSVADDAYIYNAKDNIGFHVDKCYGFVFNFNNGYLVVRDLFSGIKTIHCSGAVNTLNISTDKNTIFGQYSENLFFRGDSFYDISGKKVIDLSEHNWKIISSVGFNAPYFQNSKSRIEFKNNANTVYYTEIDKTGKVLFEPKKK